MSARINYVDRSRNRRGCAEPADSNGEGLLISAGTADENRCQDDGWDKEKENCGCGRSVDFCETVTLHESFDPCSICSSATGIAYDTSFLGYTVEELTMNASLPCGCSCPVDVYRISLTGAIPYIVNIGKVESGCGEPVCLSVQGSTMVDEVVGYACGGNQPELGDISCCSVIPEIKVAVKPCGCSGKTNVTVYGKFTFSDLPVLC